MVDLWGIGPQPSRCPSGRSAENKLCSVDLWGIGPQLSRCPSGRSAENKLCSVDLWGIGPQFHPCHGCVIPFYYRPIFITCSLTIRSSIFLFLHFFNLFSIRTASTLDGNNFLKTSFIGLCDLKDIVFPELCSFNLFST